MTIKNLPVFPNMKPIPNFECYFITNCGRIFSQKGKKNLREMKISTTARGYRVINLRNMNGEKNNFRVSRLILSAWESLPVLGVQACHKNGIRNDDRLENLYWGTASENTYDQVKHGTHKGLKSRGQNHPYSKLSQNMVDKIRRYISYGWTCKQIADAFNLKRTTISSIKHGYSWKNNSPMQ